MCGAARVLNRGLFFLSILTFLFLGANHFNPVYAETGQMKHEGSHGKSSDKIRVIKEGVAIELNTEPLFLKNGGSRKLVEGRDAKIQFSLKDPNTGEALRGLYPAAWLDRKNPKLGNLSCKEKIGSFLQAQVGFQPEVDLNTWYILALNHKGSISVIDPLVDSGASGMLLDLVLLDSPGEDWALSPKSRWIYVTLPAVGKVAVIDTDIWKVSTQIETGFRPMKIALQPDNRYLWVGLDQGIEGADQPGGVSVIDPHTKQVVSKIPTGRGHHEIAFSADSRYAYVSNEKDGTVSVIDVWKLHKIKDIKTGTRPTSLAYSKTAHAVYATDSGEGNVYVISQANNEVTAKIEVKPEATGIRFSPDGRWGFVSDPQSKSIVIFDASSNKIAHSFTVGKGPNQVVFSDMYAYVHSVGSSQISLIKMGALSERGSIPVIQIPVGKDPSKEMSDAITSNMIAITPEESSVVVANPVEENIFYYMEGMNAPMGSFGNFQRSPKAVMTVDKGLKETLPGLYEANIKLNNSGTYDVAFLLDNPKITHCFTVSIESDPKIKSARKGKIEMELLSPGKEVTVGQPLEVRVRLKDSLTGKPRSGVKDLGVQAVLAPGIWQNKVLAESKNDGEYIARFSFPKPGVYMVSFESRSLNLAINKWYPLMFRASMIKKAEGVLAKPGKSAENK